MLRKLSGIVITGAIGCLFMNNAGADPSIGWSAAEAPQPIVNDAGTSPKQSVDEIPINNPCPSDMVYVEGDYCPKAEEICLYYVDRNGKKINSMGGRCGEFKYPTRCLSKTIYKEFCIDSYEIPNIRGHIPMSWLSYTDAEDFCKAHGKRLLTDSEWTMACEGPNMKPYPYLSGYVRNTTSCNTDNNPNIDVFKATSHNTLTAIKLDSMLVPSGSMPECKSDWGEIYDQIGNEDEWITNETGVGYKTGLMGGHIFGVRNRCRNAITTAHSGENPPKGAGFAWYETSSRCGKDATF